MTDYDQGSTDWTPERKMIGVAITAIVAWGLSLVGLEVPAGVEAAAAFLVGYMVPNRRG